MPADGTKRAVRHTNPRGVWLNGSQADGVTHTWGHAHETFIRRSRRAGAHVWRDGCAHAATDTAAETFEISVGAICEFITTKSNTAGGSITNWDVDDGSDDATAVVIFRLVMNDDITLTGAFDNSGVAGVASNDTAAFKNTVSAQVLLTYANIQSDGAAATTPTLGADGHNATTDLAHSGFLATEYDTDYGVGVSTAADRFAYVGGLATVASSGAEPADTASEVFSTTAAGDFLDSTGSSILLTHVDNDGAVLLTVSMRGFNGEDYGAASDFTEAPDTGTYQTQLTLTGVSP